MPQLTFCGASVRGFNSTVGWNQQTSQFRCSVVEDHSNGDIFNPPLPGAPIYFIYGNFYFYGLLQKWTESNSVSGLPTYEVECVDPRAILEGAPIITAAYRGPVYVSNIFNAFGWWENLTGFGSSLSNDAGMPWYLILEALTVMSNSLSGLYGSALCYRGVAYSLDLSELPVPPNYYRIPGPSITIMEAINLICEDGGYDYLVELKDFNIKIRTVSRVNQPPLGTITSLRLAGWGKDLVSSTNGLEARNEISSAFIIGGEQKALFFNDITGMQRYWGLDQYGQPILGTGSDYNHTMTLNSSSISYILGSTSYTCTVLEILCAMDSYTTWSSYLCFYRPDIAKLIPLIPSFVPFKNAKAVFGNEAIPDDPKNVKQANTNFLTGLNQRGSLFHEFLRKIGNDYLGKQYLVTIPFCLVAQEPETLRFIYSQEPTDGGYLPDGSAPLGLPLLIEDQFTTTDGRFRAFCLFSSIFPNTADVKTDRLQQTDLYYSDNGAYVRCEVEQQIIFTPEPNVVVKLSNPIYHMNVPYTNSSILPKILNKPIQQIADMANNGSSATPIGMNVHGLPYDPDSVAIPLKSNILTYGPWYAQGTQGKVKFEYDTSLTPWQYGGYSYMNLAAQSKVTQAITYMQLSESGSHEEIGQPRFGLGNALQGSGPNVTGIDVTYGAQGVTTRYTMQTFSPKPYGFSKDNAKRFERLGRQNAELRKNFRTFLGTANQINISENNAYLGTLNNLPPALVRKSPHTTFMSDIKDTDNNTIRTSVVTATLQEIAASNGAHLDNVWQRTAVMSLNGLLRPFSTNPAANGISKYTVPSGNFLAGPGINNVYYNPFGKNNDLNEIAWGQTYQGMNPYAWSSNPDDTRVMALRGPLVVSGYGWTIDGKFVPGDDAGNAGSKYVDNTYQKSHLWKTGAVDMLWDNARAVWTSHDILIGKTKHSPTKPAIDANGSGIMNVYDGNSYTKYDITVYNWFGAGISGDINIMAGYCVTANKWYVIAADCPGV